MFNKGQIAEKKDQTHMKLYYTNLSSFYPNNIKKIERFKSKSMKLEINYCMISTLDKR